MPADEGGKFLGNPTRDGVLKYCLVIAFLIAPPPFPRPVRAQHETDGGSDTGWKDRWTGKGYGALLEPGGSGPLASNRRRR